MARPVMPVDEREEASADAEGDVGASHSRTTTPRARDSDAEGMAATMDAPGRTSGTHLAKGTLLEGTYRVEELLGKGAMGAVYLVEHIALGTKFAAKVVADTERMDAAGIARLRNEARMASAIDHENIVRVTHLGHTDAGNLFVVMERLHGEDLRARTVSQRAAAAAEGGDPWLSDREVRGIVGPLLSALEAAHAAGVVHRDLKPENVFLHVRQGRVVPKIVDFGIGKQSSPDNDVRLTATGQIIGTPLYMAPEQTRSTSLVDHRADIYAMGVMLFELLTGRLPFEGGGVYEIVVKHVTEPPPDPRSIRPDLPDEVAELVLRCLAKKADDRFQSAAELLAAWEDAWDLGADVPTLSASHDRRHRDPQVDERRQSGSKRSSAGRSAPRDARASDARESASTDDRARDRAAMSSAQTLEGPEPAASPEAPEATTTPATTGPRALWIVAAAFGALAIVGAVVALSAEDDPAAETRPEPVALDPIAEPTEPEPPPIVEPVATEEPAAPEPPPVLTRRIESQPPGAEVLRDGAVIGTTPLELELVDDAPVDVELRLRGRSFVRRTIAASDPGTVVVTLPRPRPRTGAFPGLAPQ